jgi:imidazolonepropionase-like amidohydrolase
VASFSVQFRYAIPSFQVDFALSIPALRTIRVCGVVHTQSGGLALTHVTIIDPAVGKPQQDMTFLVRGHDIAALGRAKRITIPASDKVIDRTGKFVIPGVWDMHSHFRDARRDLKIDRESFQTAIKYSHLEIVDKCFACT